MLIALSKSEPEESANTVASVLTEMCLRRLATTSSILLSSALPILSSMSSITASLFRESVAVFNFSRISSFSIYDSTFA